MNGSVIVWDREGDPPHAIGEVWCWQSYVKGSGVFSVPGYLEDHAVRLRGRYLAFIHELGERKVNGRRLVEHLDAGDGFSLWWMSQVAEKSPFKSPKTYDCLRMLALEEILVHRETSFLILDSSNRELAAAVWILCRNLGINFSWRRARRPGRRWTARRIFRGLPHSLQGLISLARHVLMRLPLRKVGKPQWFGGADSIFLCSYFFNLDSASCAEGRFHSMQWGSLADHLRQSGKHANWIHHFLTSPGMPSADTCVGWMRLFNRDARRQGYHAFLDTYLSWGIVFRALRKWVWLNGVSWRLRGIQSAFYPKGSSVWLWPFLRDDWHTSLTGQVAINNCLWIELFDTVLKEMPRQKIGLYLWENQGWESAMLRAWRRHGHGEIVGVPHATVCFWHLNNFVDPRSLTSDRIGRKPMPNRLAVNGPMAWKAFVDTGYPIKEIVEVEALRFQYLTELGSDCREKSDIMQRTAFSADKNTPTRILILGDFTFVQTIKMLRCVEEMSHLLAGKLAFTLKPHPVCRIGKHDYPSLSFELVDRPIGEIIRDYDFAFASNSTSAGLDTYLAGLPVAIFLDDTTFNNSPLRGLNGVRFVSNASELAAALRLLSEGDQDSRAVENVFWVDERLPRWREMLSEAGVDR